MLLIQVVKLTALLVRHINVDDSLVGSATAPVISIDDATDPGDKGAVTIASDLMLLMVLLVLL